MYRETSKKTDEKIGVTVCNMEQMTLFDQREEMTPLANRLRPDTLADFVGQEHLLGPGKMLRQLIERDQISSMIFWGPPGVGKKIGRAHV